MEAKRPEPITTAFPKRNSIDRLVSNDHEHHAAHPDTGCSIHGTDLTRAESKVSQSSTGELKSKTQLRNGRSFDGKRQGSPTFKVKFTQNDVDTKDIHLDGLTSAVLTIGEIEEMTKIARKKKVEKMTLPRKHVILASCLLITGFIALLVGTIYAIKSNNAEKGMAFWILGGLCVLPGIFTGWRLFKACYAKTTEGRRRALESVPKE